MSAAGAFLRRLNQRRNRCGLESGRPIDLEQVQDGLWNILYYDTLLERFDERTKAISETPFLRGDL